MNLKLERLEMIILKDALSNHIEESKLAVFAARNGTRGLGLISLMAKEIEINEMQKLYKKLKDYEKKETNT